MSSHDATLCACLDEFRITKAYGEKAFVQLRDDDFFFRLNSTQSSIAAYVRHLHGNMLSRWTDCLTTDGEKPHRNREGEFAEAVVPRAELMSLWESGWATVLAAVGALQPGDLERTIYIRTEPYSVARAITRQIAHYGWHVGQIVLLAKHIKASRGEPWNYMTIPPGGTSAFNASRGMGRP
jgi:hypothetical protein